MDNYGEVLIYQSEDGITNIDVRIQDETVVQLFHKKADSVINVSQREVKRELGLPIYVLLMR